MIERLESLRDRDLAAEGLLLLEGSHLADRGLEAGLRIVRMDCVPAASGRYEAASARLGFPLSRRSEAEMSALAGYPFHRGVLALAQRPAIADLAALPRGSGALLCLWAVADQENLGALARSAASLGAAGIVLGPGCADPYGRKSLRASMGALLRLPLFRSPLDPEDACRLLSERGYGNLAATGSGTPLAELRSSGARSPSGLKPPALWLGNEGEGLPEALMSACEDRVAIPMSGLTDSLNVAAAGAILMWELFGKRT